MRRFASFARLGVCVALVASAPSSRAPAQTPPTPPQARPEFRAGAAVVVLDVVARDKKGRPVRDLTPAELQVLENGERCEIRSFRLVEGASELQPAGVGPVSGTVSAVAPASPEGTGATDATRLPLNLVTLVFDRLDIEGNTLARKAALDFVERGMSPRTQVAVFKIGARLGVVEQYTTDPEPLRRAIEASTSGADINAPALTKDALKAAEDVQLASDAPLPVPVPEVADATQSTVERVTSADARGPERYQREAVARALKMADSLQRQMEGEWSIYPLLALVKAQVSLPGRKTLLFFSPGLKVPPNLDDVFRTVISEANRSNVSVYAVDARGLQSSRSDLANSAAALRQAATTSMLQQVKSGGEATTREEMQIIDTAEDSLRLNVQQTLSDLSEGTGGFLVANANDFGKAVDRLAADIRGYYEIVYAPARADFDGGFRKIDVKLARKDVVLQSRLGYFALPPSDRIVLPYEVPLLAAVSAPAPAHDFEHRTGAAHFASGPEGTDTVVLVEVPLEGMEFQIDNKKKRFGLRLATLAVVRDASGQVVERFSDEYPLGGPLDQLEELKQANAVLRRTVALAPGRYVLETAAQVKASGRTSVQTTSFEVPTAGDGPRLSSLCLLRRADPLPADAPPSDDPFRYEGARLVPHLAGPVSRAATPNLSFFARVYPVPGAEPPKLTLDFVREGKIVGRAQPPLPAPDASGRMAYLGGVPSAGFAPGAYEVRLTVVQGAARAIESSRFELVP